ncbi:hypothetical protein FRX31_023355 [Thalictrum thalictroides]|uniref:Uncharacterized protein n=1 Tax=Thalictrum thalictroides TaxID=46969 RepID=A0A7J6VR49_THATH|nr:hypothetical protein FRX31_023355 [Thalictrum thalictroides]
MIIDFSIVHSAIWWLKRNFVLLLGELFRLFIQKRAGIPSDNRVLSLETYTLKWLMESYRFSKSIWEELVAVKGEIVNICKHSVTVIDEHFSPAAVGESRISIKLSSFDPRRFSSTQNFHRFYYNMLKIFCFVGSATKVREKMKEEGLFELFVDLCFRCSTIS